MLMQREEILRPLCKPGFVKFGVGEANLLVILEAIKRCLSYIAFLINMYWFEYAALF